MLLLTLGVGLLLGLEVAALYRRIVWIGGLGESWLWQGKIVGERMPRPPMWGRDRATAHWSPPQRIRGPVLTRGPVTGGKPKPGSYVGDRAGRRAGSAR